MSLLITSSTISPIPLPTPDAVQRAVFEFVKAFYGIVIPLMVIILLIAIIGNGVICVSSRHLPSPVSPYLKLCVSLSAADLWAATLLIAGLLVNSYLPVVLGIRQKFVCMEAFLEAFRVAAMLTSDWHLFALAVNQFVGTMWPLKYRMLVTTRRMRFLLGALWVIPLIIVFGWFTWSADDGLRSPECSFFFYNRFPFRASVFLLFTVPLLATLVLYTLIVAHLMKAKAEFESKSGRNESQLSIHRVGMGKSVVAGKLKLVWTTLLILLSFCLSWGLCVLYFTLVCEEGCLLKYRVSLSFYASLWINTAVNFMVMMKLASNPFIYTLRIRKFRKSVHCLIRKIKIIVEYSLALLVAFVLINVNAFARKIAILRA
ncbi:unnamed protein product, partial [Mesorhabditis belari]|uniref:G-protein coupled receptors family 1 profile domain-containing protein n=1 Tax=Mesorhabditis belari TaxID=2138241 RepID=A0AAF3FC51_9BILA